MGEDFTLFLIWNMDDADPFSEDQVRLAYQHMKIKKPEVYLT